MSADTSMLSAWQARAVAILNEVAEKMRTGQLDAVAVVQVTLKDRDGEKWVAHRYEAVLGPQVDAEKMRAIMQLHSQPLPAGATTMIDEPGDEPGGERH
jgi:hypothetical protein